MILIRFISEFWSMENYYSFDSPLILIIIIIDGFVVYFKSKSNCPRRVISMAIKTFYHIKSLLKHVISFIYLFILLLLWKTDKKTTFIACLGKWMNINHLMTEVNWMISKEGHKVMEYYYIVHPMCRDEPFWTLAKNNNIWT